MTRSELIERISQRYPDLPPMDVEMAVKGIIERMARSRSGQRVEVRGLVALHWQNVRLEWAVILGQANRCHWAPNTFPVLKQVRPCVMRWMHRAHESSISLVEIPWVVLTGHR